jgi:hypothetical protein
VQSDIKENKWIFAYEVLNDACEKPEAHDDHERRTCCGKAPRIVRVQSTADERHRSRIALAEFSDGWTIPEAPHGRRNRRTNALPQPSLMINKQEKYKNEERWQDNQRQEKHGVEEDGSKHGLHRL